MSNLQTTTTDQPDRATANATCRLVFPHGVANLTIRVDASMASIYRGEYYGPKPRVTEAEGVISIDYPRFNPLTWGRTAADITVHPSVAWLVHIRDGVSRWAADLRNVALAGIDVRGGVSRVDLQLPRPAGTVRGRVSCGASLLRVRGPCRGAARSRVGRGA